MLSSFKFSALAFVAFGLAACGSGGSSTTGSAHRALGASHPSRPTRSYRVQLSRATEPTRGAPHGTGAAIIAFHGESRVCWRFAHLHGFSDATTARIYSGAQRSGSEVLALSTGPRLHHRGCARITPVQSRKIWNDPSRYYVSIESRQYPRGAVRGQL